MACDWEELGIGLLYLPLLWGEHRKRKVGGHSTKQMHNQNKRKKSERQKGMEGQDDFFLSYKSKLKLNLRCARLIR